MPELVSDFNNTINKTLEELISENRHRQALDNVIGVEDAQI